MMASYDDVFEKVRGVLEEALGVDGDEVTKQATLGPDLGAESIDYLDISFRLEKAFTIKINQSEMMPSDVLSNEEYVKDGRITDKGIAELKTKMPHADLSQLESSRDVDDFEKVFTVDSIVKFVMSKLG